ncbi:thiamine pyrophosphate-binding protein [Devosia beringensis]|uniref:thiamine pyrophosphate-binding protein n=1 Tax=Devosia beringensis TaxID=2657486 RepID=UPI00186B5E0E|nr:thiamine pyrophosphate-binding protein [Devosia beringensis]
MSHQRQIYHALAEAFAAEGVDTQFGLMGDGNMLWMTAMSHLPGMTTFGVRHEHCACMMAIGYWSATGKVGVASVTHGPGFTQTMTALTTAARNFVPLVVFAGEAPLTAPWYLQAMDHAALAKACGAEYIPLHSTARMYHDVREAFYIAQFDRKPVVIGVPADLQELVAPDLGTYRPSAELLPQPQRITPDPGQIAELASLLSEAKAPVIVAGRGVMQSDARSEVEALAEKTGAMLGTSLLAKGMFDHNPNSLGIVGGYARQASRDVGKSVDLVVVFGASLSRFTTDSGKMFPNAKMVQVDILPTGYREGLKPAHVYIKADAKLAATALLAAVASKQAKADIRSLALSKRLREEPADDTRYIISDGTLDPRRVFEELERVIPTDYDFVSGSAHQAYWHTTMRGADPRNYHAVRAFGAIGNAFAFASGIAVARKNGRVVLFEGDGGLLMQIQELESLKRQGVKLLIVCCNDGAFGAEVHKLRKDGIDDSGAVFGRPPFEAIAKGFGVRGATISDIAQFAGLMKDYEAHADVEIWDVHVSDQVLAPNMRDAVGYKPPTT